MRTKTIYTVVAASLMLLMSSCDYEEDVTLCNVEVQLVGRPNTTTRYEPTADIEVQLTDATASVFISPTELVTDAASGDVISVARFRIPAGLYSASVSFQRWGEKDERYPTSPRYWQYIYNGNIANKVVSSDSLVNRIELTVSVVRQSRYRPGI
ncbi:MAG: hypothetical protein IJ698_00975 [Prevotella sp.]|nr:hypothetical protein [Prevotella sp.]